MPKHDINKQVELISEWGKKRGFVKFENRSQQLHKLSEEVGELHKAFLESNQDEIIDAIGDIFVVCSLFCDMSSLEISNCIDSAYNTIKDRTGVVVNGSYIKDGE